MYGIGNRPRFFDKVATSAKSAAARGKKVFGKQSARWGSGGTGYNSSDSFSSHGDAPHDDAAAVAWDRSDPRAGNPLARSNAKRRQDSGPRTLGYGQTDEIGTSVRPGVTLRPGPQGRVESPTFNAKVLHQVSALDRLAQALQRPQRAPISQTTTSSASPRASEPVHVDVDAWATFG